MVADDEKVATSVFDYPQGLRHQRRTSNSIVGRGGFSPVCAPNWSIPTNTRNARIRKELEKAIKDQDIDRCHVIYQRELTKLPLENREIYRLRKDVVAVIQEKLKSALDARVKPEFENKPKSLAKELKAAIDLANKQEGRFPYAKECMNLKSYKECQEALKTLEAQADGDLDSAFNRSGSLRMTKAVSFSEAQDSDDGGPSF